MSRHLQGGDLMAYLGGRVDESIWQPGRCVECWQQGVGHFRRLVSEHRVAGQRVT